MRLRSPGEHHLLETWARAAGALCGRVSRRRSFTPGRDCVLSEVHNTTLWLQHTRLGHSTCFLIDCVETGEVSAASGLPELAVVCEPQPVQVTTLVIRATQCQHSQHSLQKHKNIV